MDQISSEVVKLAFALATPFLLAYAMAAVKKLNARIGLQVSAENQARLESFARLAIQQAEEWAAARVKAQVPTVASDKLQYAMNAVLKKVPGVTPDEAADLIHAKLPELGLGAAADFLKAVRQAAVTEPAK